MDISPYSSPSKLQEDMMELERDNKYEQEKLHAENIKYLIDYLSKRKVQNKPFLKKSNLPIQKGNVKKIQGKLNKK